MREPVLAIAGSGDVLAPQPAVHHVGELLENAASVQLETVPGGHLGALDGHVARARRPGPTSTTSWPPTTCCADAA